MPFQAPRGTYDILPREEPDWQHLIHVAENLSDRYGYSRIDTPVFEDAGLFVRSIGEETDIVEKEMYTFEDRSGDRLTLRPEGTASVCRAYLEHGMHNLVQPVRLYYIAQIFRYERPQAGRFRQHWQFGVEALGGTDPALDAEVIDLAWSYYHQLSLQQLVLKLNSIGCNACRPAYVAALKQYYSAVADQLCPDCRRRRERNPLRLLDCKNQTCIQLAGDAPRCTDYLCSPCTEHFAALCRYLDILGLRYETDHRLVRGLDYYTRTVFEIQPAGAAGAQSTIGGGGRYDNLIEQLGGKPTPAVGFGTGLERLILNRKKQQVQAAVLPAPKVMIAYLGAPAKERAIAIVKTLRTRDIAAIPASGDKSLKAQMRQANALNTSFTIIIGDDELRDDKLVLRDMAKGTQERLTLEEAVGIIGDK